MRATLLEGRPRVTALLFAAFSYSYIPLTKVSTLVALQVAIAQARRDDFVILDVTAADPEEIGRYAGILRQPDVAVHVIYRDEHILTLLAPLAAAPLYLLPVTIGWDDLLDKLEALQRHVYADRLAQLRRPLTSNQRALLAAIGAGASRTQAAAALGMRPGTARTHVRRLMTNLEVDSLDELRAFHRLNLV